MQSFYRTQAQTFAGLALVAINEAMVELYNQMALEYLTKAEEVEPSRCPRLWWTATKRILTTTDAAADFRLTIVVAVSVSVVGLHR